ncbi:MAG: hypothetical protein QNL33_14285 [Akkermansiaceae bacterium]|jgi:hypothetical protein
MNSERKLANHLLKFRHKSPNPWASLKPTTRFTALNYLCVIYLVAMILWGPSPEYDRWLFLASGLVLGSFMRNLKIIAMQARFWPFTQKVTNWDMVADITQYEICEKRKATRAAKRFSSDKP